MLLHSYGLRNSIILGRPKQNKQYGKIIECRTLVDPKTTISRCTAFVQFDTRREAKDALKFMNGHVLPGAKKGLLVKFAEDHHRRVQRQEQGQVLVLVCQ